MPITHQRDFNAILFIVRNDVSSAIYIYWNRTMASTLYTHWTRYIDLIELSFVWVSLTVSFIESDWSVEINMDNGYNLVPTSQDNDLNEWYQMQSVHLQCRVFF